MADDIKKIQEREAKWQRRWRDANAFVPKNDGKKPLKPILHTPNYT